MNCLARKSILNTRLGDYRRAEIYAVSLVNYSGLSDCPASTARSTFKEVLSCSSQVDNLREKACLRLRLEVQAMATSLDQVARNLLESQSRSSERIFGRISASEIAHIQDLISRKLRNLIRCFRGSNLTPNLFQQVGTWHMESP